MNSLIIITLLIYNFLFWQCFYSKILQNIYKNSCKLFYNSRREDTILGNSMNIIEKYQNYFLCECPD